jgi:transposase
MGGMNLADADQYALRAIIAAQAEELADLRAQVTALTAQVAEVTARLGQNATNSSRPPSSDPSGGRPRPPATGSSGRRPGGQPGHRGHHRELVPVEQVDRCVPVLPATCEACGDPLAAEAAPTDPAEVRGQVVDLPAVPAHVTEYRMAARQCRACGHLTRAALPAAAGPLGFGPRLMAIVVLLTGRYRLSKREAAQCMADLFGVEVAVGSVTRIEQVASAALAPTVAAAQAAVQTAAVANVDETSWREGRRRVWLWTVVTATLTVFHIHASRGGKVAQALLGARWRGVRGSDRGPM